MLQLHFFFVLGGPLPSICPLPPLPLFIIRLRVILLLPAVFFAEKAEPGASIAGCTIEPGSLLF